MRWTDQLAALRPGREVWNWGENGREIPRRPWELQRQEEALQKAAPVDGVVIMLGSNDLLQMSPPQAEVVVERMRSGPAVPRPGRSAGHPLCRRGGVGSGAGL